MSTSGAPQTQPQSSEHFYAGELAKKTSSRTQDVDSRRRERRFAELLEFLMPVCLLPFVFGDNAGISIYCVMVTVMGLTGRLLPPAVAAMLPIVILPLAGAFTADEVAAEFLGPRVLAASLLFAIANVGDETTLFSRMCLYALQRYALRIQPLFLSVQLMVLVLSLFLPSSFIVIFSTVLIERFITTVQKEITTADQRSGIRAPTSSSSQNFIEEVRRQRRQRQHAAGGAAKRARSVSMVSDTTMPSEVSRNSSLVRQYKMHPEWHKERSLEAVRQVRRPRKTSFDPFDRTSDAGVWACRLPGRTINSFASQKKQPSSILKNSAKGKDAEPIPSTERGKGSPTVTSARALFSPARATAIPATKTASVSKKEPKEQQPLKPPSEAVTKPKVVEPAMLPSAKVAEEKPDAAKKAAVKEDGGKRVEEILEPGDDTLELLQSSSPSSMTPASPASPSTSPFMPSSQTSSSTPVGVADLWSSAPNAQGGERSVDSYTAWASQLMSGSSCRLLRLNETLSPEEPSSVADKSVVNFYDSEFQAQSYGRNLLQALQRMHVQTFTEVSQLYAKAAPQAQLRPEVRGVLKAGRSSTSLLPSAHSRRESVGRRWSLASLDNDIEAVAGGLLHPLCRPIMGDAVRRRMMVRAENGASARRIVIASQPYPVADMPSSFLDSGDEQVSSCIRLRALMMMVRPALIAGTAYTAIFGNMMSLNTVPTRQAVLLSLGCATGKCPVNWWIWLTVAFPASLACCLIIWVYVYCSHLVSCDEEIEEQTHEDMSNCARARLRTMKRQTVRETLLIYWLIGVPFTYGAYTIGHPESYLEGPLFGLSVVVMSVVPGLTCHQCWSHRMLSWNTICARLPWNVIIMLGCVMALTKVVEKYSLIQSFLNQLDDHFWTRRSIKANQFILASLAALLSEMVVGDTLGEMLAPVVVRVAVATNCSAAFYVVPVSLAASVNVMLPVSLPLLIIREYLNIKCVKMVAYGVFLKCTAVLVIVASMNSLGTMFFSSEPVTKSQAWYTLDNATHIEGIPLP